jgi:hypothetical protein
MKIDLNEALRSYIDQPVPLGMEARILSRCRRRSWRWPVMAFATAAGRWRLNFPCPRSW